MAARIEYLDEEPAGLAAMLGGLIEANLASNPERERLLKTGLIHMIADDAGVSITVRLAPGVVTIGNGIIGGRPDLLIRTTSEDLIGLTSVPLRLGLPDAFTSDGRKVMGNLMSGRLKVKGMFRNLPTLTRLQRLLSVA